MVVPIWGQPRTFGEGNRRGSCSTESAESFRPLAAALGQKLSLVELPHSTLDERMYSDSG
jgi:hypothetical protein